MTELTVKICDALPYLLGKNNNFSENLCIHLLLVVRLFFQSNVPKNIFN